jgi:hypothetical protein
MKRRGLLLLGVAATASVGAALLLTPDGVAPPPPASPLAFPGLAARLGSAARIEVVRHDGALLIERRGEAWVLPAKDGYRVRPERVRELLVGLTELRLAEPRTVNPAQQAQLGVDDPTTPGSTATLLRLVDASGAPMVELVLGRRRMRVQGNLPESIYVRRPTETQTWLAEGRLPVDGDLNLWIDRDIANLPRDRVMSLAVVRGDAPALRLRRADGADARLSVVEPEEVPALDDIALDDIGRAFEFLTFLDVRRAEQVPGERIGIGLFELTDNLKIGVALHRDEDALWALLDAEGDAEATALAARWRGWAYQIGQWKEKAMVPRLADLAKQER